METTQKLFSEFPSVSKDDWKQKVIKDLRGADFDEKLRWATDENIAIEPLMTNRIPTNLVIYRIIWLEIQKPKSLGQTLGIGEIVSKLLWQKVQKNLLTNELC